MWGTAGFRMKGKPMPQSERRRWWRRLALACAIVAAVWPAANAKESSGFIKNAEEYLAKGDLKAAEIELKNAIRQSPQDPLLRVRLAQVYLQLGDPASAEIAARAAKERDADEADYLPVLADALLRQEKFQDLVDLIQPSDRAPALESKVRSGLGLAALGLHDQDKAEQMFRDAIQLDPNAVAPKVQLARLLAGKNPQEADKLIEEALVANPQATEVLLAKGEMLRARGNLDGAVNLFEQVIKIDPKNLPAHLNRANINIAEGKFKAADEDLDPILKAAPNNFMANYLRALELAKQQQYPAADRIFDRISPAFPRFWSGYYLQGAVKMALGQFAQAESILGKYTAHSPDDQRALRLMANAALQQRAPIRAIEYLRPLADKPTTDAATLSVLGNAYMADGKPELALQQFEKAAALDPENPTIKARIAISEINTGKSQEGLTQLEQVFATEAGETIAGPTLVLSELRAGRIKKASEVAASLIKLDANNALYQTLLGIVDAAQRDYPAAEAAFRAALARNPEFVAATRDLAQLYVVSGRTEDAKKVYGDLLSNKANDVTALLGLADIAIAEKKWPEATSYLNRARTAGPNDPQPGIKLVTLYELRQDWKDALAIAGELVAQFPRDANVHIAQATAELGAGDTKSAIASYGRAHDLAPGSMPILSRYVTLLNSAKEFREARSVLEDAIARDPKNVFLKGDLIRVEAAVDGADSALAKARAFATDDPNNNLYVLISAEIYEKTARPKDAIALLEKAVATHPSDDALTIALSRLYTGAGDLTKAEALLNRRMAADPKSLTLPAVLASLYVTTGRGDEAKKIYTEILAQRPSDVGALLGLGEISVAEKRWPEATDYITRARTAAPSDPRPGLMLVNMYGLQQDWKKAAPLAAELVAQFPANVEVLDAQGRVQIGSGDMNGALSTYKRAYALAPNSGPLLSRYLALLKQAKNFADAKIVLQDALDRDPQNSALKGELIRVEAQIGGLEAGLAKAREIRRK